MATTNSSKSFAQNEQACEHLFAKGGPYWHLYTSGNQTEILFTSDPDFKFAVTALAISLTTCDVTLITDIIMDNHIHLIAEGSQSACIGLFEDFKKRLKRYFGDNGRLVNFQGFSCNILPITTLDSIRNEIVYTNRNGYVAFSQHTPFSYPWGSCSLYFNHFSTKQVGIPFNELPYREKRMLCHSRMLELPPSYKVLDGMIMPVSYSQFQKGQLFFRNAHHYFYLLTKNVEVYGKVAQHLGDTLFLTDEELYLVIYQHCVKEYNLKRPSLLPPNAKIEVAKMMHNQYHATNAQLFRILRLDKKIIETLFPRLHS